MATYSKLLLCILLFVANQLSSQVPNISYSNSSYTFPVGIAISPLTPTNTGGTIASPGSVGLVSTLAGSGIAAFANGTGTAASFNYPHGVAVDGSGNIYVADRDNNLIRKISPVGVVSTLAGSGIPAYADGMGTAASFNYPHGVAVDHNGNVYVADGDNHRIRKISPAGLVSTLAGSGTPAYADDTGKAASFYYPFGIAVDGSENVFVADQGNNRIRKISPEGVVSTLAGSGTPAYADGTGTEASFYYPFGIAVDGSGNVFVADHFNHRIRKISPTGVVSTLAGSGTPAYADSTGIAASFNYPQGIALDGIGYVYVSDWFNNRIRKISPEGVVSTLAGSGNYAYADGTGTAASFDSPTGIAVDSSGNVYVADGWNQRIRKIKQIYLGGYLVSPSLPAGLSFNDSTGVISGIPTVVTSSKVYTITATNSFGIDTTTIRITTICTENHWTGVMDDRWDNPENWSCKILPDGSQNVVISGGKPNAPVVRSNVTIKSLRQYGPSELTIANGVTFKILE